MKPEEAVLFKQYDTRGGGPKMAFHPFLRHQAAALANPAASMECSELEELGNEHGTAPNTANARQNMLSSPLAKESS